MQVRTLILERSSAKAVHFLILASIVGVFAVTVIPGNVRAQTGTTTATTTTGFMRDLWLGSTGTDVAALQTLLALDTVLYPQGLVTGYFGELTQAAVRRFQERYRIPMTGYVGPLTRAALQEFMMTKGMAVTPGIPSTGAQTVQRDMSAPVMSIVTVTPGKTDATISWTTDEAAWSRVRFGSLWPFSYEAAPLMADGSFDTSASVTLTGLTPTTTYYFVRESVDAAGNVQWSAPQQFRTL